MNHQPSAINHRPFTTAAFFLAAVVFGLCVPVLAQDSSPRIVDVAAANSRADVLLYARVENGFTPEMEKGVKNGIPATFTFEVRLVREVRDWPDRELINISFDHRLEYDNLKDEYRVILGEDSGRTVTVSTLAEAERIMTTVDGARVISLSALKKGESYALWVKARLEHATLPLYFHYLIPFWGAWDLKTDWSHVRFHY